MVNKKRMMELKRRTKKPPKPLVSGKAGKRMAVGGNLKEVPADNKGLSKLPTKVRNRMGYKKGGGEIAVGSVGGGSTRGTPEQGQRAFESEKAQMKEFQDYMKYIEGQLSDNRGAKKKITKKSTGGKTAETKKKISEVTKGLKKASKTHAKQAKTLSSIKLKEGGKPKSRVNEAGNYTKPGMRKRLFESIKAGGKGGKPGQWSARKAQMLAKRYKERGGGYKS